VLNTNSPAKTTEIAGNGKLSSEQFAAAGIPVTETAARPAPAVAGEFGANVRSKTFFEGTITAAWQKTTQGIFDTGRALLAAQEELDRDVFKALRLPFGKRTKERLMTIAGNEVLATHVSQLPPHWGTLYELDKIPDSELRALLANGKIHPGLERREVAALYESSKKAIKKTKKPPVPKLAEIWPVSSPAEKREILEYEGRTGLAEISPALLAELRDHAIALQINSAPSSNSTDLRVTLTNLFRSAVCGTTPEEMSAGCAAFVRKCTANNLDPRDLLITFPRKRASKRG
jgi:hypothetical protein